MYVIYFRFDFKRPALQIPKEAHYAAMFNLCISHSNTFCMCVCMCVFWCVNIWQPSWGKILAYSSVG